MAGKVKRLSRSDGVTVSAPTPLEITTIGKNKWQLKNLAIGETTNLTDIATNGNASNNDFHFTGMTVGTHYRLTMQSSSSIGTASADRVYLAPIHSGTTFTCFLQNRSNVAGGDQYLIIGTSVVFVATATTLTFDTLITNGTLNAVGTYIMLEELNNYEVTTDF